MYVDDNVIEWKLNLLLRNLCFVDRNFDSYSSYQLLREQAGLLIGKFRRQTRDNELR